MNCWENSAAIVFKGNVSNASFDVLITSTSSSLSFLQGQNKYDIVLKSNYEHFQNRTYKKGLTFCSLLSLVLRS